MEVEGFMYSWDYYEEGFWFGFFACITRQRQREKLVAIAFCMVELILCVGFFGSCTGVWVCLVLFAGLF